MVYHTPKKQYQIGTVITIILTSIFNLKHNDNNNPSKHARLTTCIPYIPSCTFTLMPIPRHPPILICHHSIRIESISRS